MKRRAFLQSSAAGAAGLVFGSWKLFRPVPGDGEAAAIAEFRVPTMDLGNLHGAFDPVPVLWNHDPDRTIGRVVKAEPYDQGLDVTVAIADRQIAILLEERVIVEKTAAVGPTEAIPASFRGKPFFVLSTPTLSNDSEIEKAFHKADAVDRRLGLSWTVQVLEFVEGSDSWPRTIWDRRKIVESRLISWSLVPAAALPEPLTVEDVERARAVMADQKRRAT